jgi:hypothetical protein
VGDGTTNTIKKIKKRKRKNSDQNLRQRSYGGDQSTQPQELAFLDPQEWDHNNVNPDRNHDRALAPNCHNQHSHKSWPPSIPKSGITNQRLSYVQEKEEKDKRGQ